MLYKKIKIKYTKNIPHFLALSTFIFIGNTIAINSASALLEFPSDINKTQNTNFLQNILNKINFGFSNKNEPKVKQLETIPQNTQFNNNTNYNTFNDIDTFNQNSLKNQTDYINNTNSSKSNNVSEIINKSDIINNKSAKMTNADNKLLSDKEIQDKLTNFIKEINQKRSGLSTLSNTSAVSSNYQNTQTNQNQAQISQAKQNEINQNLNSNVFPQQGYSSCGFTANEKERNECVNSMRIMCQQSYIGGEAMLPECKNLPLSTYSNIKYNSEPTYDLDDFTNNRNYFTRADTGSKQVSFSENYFNREGNYIGPDRVITGNATHYACTKTNGQYTPDNFLISTYKYITAFGQKARYGTNVGDNVNACNFNYCGVAVPLMFIKSAYGSKAAAKNQPIQIINTENLKCIVAPIQDISAVRTFTHSGSNAVIDLSLCAMEKLSNKGSIRVQYKPLKKGELGCGQ